MLGRVNEFVGNVGRVLLGLAALLAVCGVLYGAYTFFATWKSEELLRKKYEALQVELEKTKLQIKLLTTDERISRLRVLDQKKGDDEKVQSLVEFVEVSKDGTEIGKPRRYLLPGAEFYLEYYSVAFEDEHVLSEDVLKGTAIFLFRRIYGSSQAPDDGFVIEERGSRPTVYSSGQVMSELEHKIWAEFWKFALDPELAKTQGIRAAQTISVGNKLAPGMEFEVTVRKSGEISIKPIRTDIPPIPGPTT